METSGKNQSEEQLNQWLGTGDGDFSLPQDEPDLSVERLFESVEASPLGRLLKIISGLPEMRPEKLAIARRHLNQPDEVIDAKMDAAIDRVLEELLSE